jgi:hypothetical protein
MAWLIDRLRGKSGRAPQVVVDSLEGAPPVKGQWYRLVGSAEQITDHAYCCKNGTFAKIPRDIFAWEVLWNTGGESYCLRTWLESLVETARMEKAYIATGLPAHPDAYHLSLAEKNGKLSIKPKTGPATKEELAAAYNSLPRFKDSLSTPQSGPRFFDPDDPKNGGSTGEYDYSGSNRGPETLAEIGFGDPHMASFRPR